ncbi:MAG TPA: YgaP-like transmembrane domain [Thermoanaerobaculia bacterium]|nr:YgaP-like transmembrane domain [Thermoanaerobaculia bacterium]
MAMEESRLSNRWAGLNREKLSQLGNNVGNVLNREKLGQAFSRENLGNVNVGKTERWASVLGGAALAALALRKGRGKSALGLAALAGLPLIWRGATGHCAVYEKLGIDKGQGTGQGTSLASTHTDADRSFDEGRVTRLDERTEGRPVTTTDRQPIGQNF